ncbi:MAG: ABC transporter ATP-binding protein [Romboutsia sp.]
MSSVQLINITKSFNENKVLNNIDLSIKEGEIVSLLGKSGCGKSTTLQIIAGLIQPDSGDILFNQSSVLNVCTQKRNAVIVFQDYLLFPHMTVYENIEFGLKMKGEKKYIRKLKVYKLIELVKLKGFEEEYPSQLSGGQKQRVAIARTLAINPKVLLLDEPFSNLDINLRNEMREFVLDLQKKLKITTILVTHDKEEALMMSDKIAVMIDGSINQFDTPINLYKKPTSKEVANIFGDRNYIRGCLKDKVFKSDVVTLNLNIDKDYENIELMIPTENVKVSSKDYKKGIDGFIVKKRYAGEKTYYHVDIDGFIIKSSSYKGDYEENEIVKVSIDTKNIIYFE